MCKLVSVDYYKELANSIIHNVLWSQPTAPCDMKRTVFSDKEIWIEFKESLRGKHLFVIGEISQHLTETLLIIDAARRSSVKEITLILPYYGYSRQDKREGKRGCIGSSMLARTLEFNGVNRVVTIDLHADQTQGCFFIPFDHLDSRVLFVPKIKELMKETPGNYILCAPDAGGIKRVEKYSESLRLPMVNINKKRDKPGSIGSMQLFGDVKDMDVILVDDIFDSGGTVIKANELLKENGARNIYNFITHPIISKPANIALMLRKGFHLITSNTIPNVLAYPAIEYVDCSEAISNIIIEIMNEGSVMKLNEKADQY
jgi:ribose-phosphate pyrophosphokinase